MSAPTNVVAQAVSTSQIDVTWTTVPTAVSYDIYRSTSGSSFVLAGSASGTSFSDTALASNTTYEYQVQAIDGTGTAGPLSSSALGTTAIFTDDPLVPGTTPIRGVHITDLRTAVDSVRAAAALGAYSFTDASLTDVAVKSTHVLELRDALNQALTTLAMPLLVPTNSAAGGTVIAAVDISEIRGHVSGITSTQPAPVSFCARGPASDTFSPSMQGCAGSVTFANRAAQCGAGYHVCTATEWVSNRNGIVPKHTYWTSDALRYGNGGFSGNCYVSLTTVNTSACVSPAQMLVCSPTGDGSNTCAWVNCGYNSVSPNQYFGGCGSTAGSLCCKDTIWYVATSGSDSNSGTTPASPFRTITHALSVATAGQQVFVAPGTYTSGETFPLAVPPAVALIGDEANSGAGTTPTSIVTSGSGAVTAGANSTVAGFTITSSSGPAVATSSGTATIRNDTLSGSTYGLTVSGASTAPIVTGNTITNNIYGIFFSASSAAGKFESNVIAHNTSYGVYYGTSGGDLGGGAAGSAGGNTISCNTNADLYVGGVSGVSAANNRWDHAVPTTSSSSPLGGIDIYVIGSVVVSGSSTASAPCP